MKKKYIITASSLLLLGALIFGGMMTMLKWNFKSLSTNKYETNVHEITEEFTDVTLIGDTANVTFVPAADNKTTVTCHEETYAKHAVAVKDGMLTVELQNEKKWYHYLSIGSAKAKITVALPLKEYGALQIAVKTGDVLIPESVSFTNTAVKTTTGNITLQGVSTGELELAVSTGKVMLERVSSGDTKITVSTGNAHLTECKLQSLTTNGKTGDITMENVIVDGLLAVERSTGDVRFTACDAGTVSITTDTGNVTGSFLSDKIVYATTDTGKVDVPRSTEGGSCEIKTDTGNIKITVN